MDAVNLYNVLPGTDLKLDILMVAMAEFDYDPYGHAVHGTLAAHFDTYKELVQKLKSDQCRDNLGDDKI